MRDCVLYVDSDFLLRRTIKTLQVLKKEYPDREFSFPEIEDILLSAAQWLQLSGDVVMYLFAKNGNLPEEVTSGQIQRDTVTLFSSVVYAEYLVEEMCRHLGTHGRTFKEIALVGDDQAFAMCSIKPNKILRLDNDNTNMTMLGDCAWQDVDYAIQGCFGLDLHEMVPI